MIILGIDPGSARIGYGIIEGKRDLSLITCGVIQVKKKGIKPHELAEKIADELAGLIKKYKPEMSGVEKIFFSKNVKTGIEVAQMRGAIILELARHKIPVREFTPSEIKVAATGYGFADKKSVSKMVSKILNCGELKGLDDASDALAIAIAASRPETWNNY